MFEEYVEHAGTSQPGVLSPTELSNLPTIEYEGFEPDGRSEDGGEGIEAMETGYFSGLSLASQSLPIFSLSHVQFSLPSTLLSLDVNSNLLAMAIKPLSLILIDLSRPSELINIDLPRPAATSGGGSGRGTPDLSATPSISRVYGDPTGKHLLITTTGGDTFYASTSAPARKARPLRLKSPVSCVAWASPAHVSSSSSAECLLGSPSGAIYTLTLPPSEDIFKAVAKTTERDYTQVFTLPEGQAVTGLGFGFWSSPNARKERIGWVVATTRERLYELQGQVGNTSVAGGKGGWADEVFKSYRDSTPKFQELPSECPASQLVFHAPVDRDSKATSLIDAAAWLSGPGLYCSRIPTASSPSSISSGQPIFTAPSLIPWPSTSLPALQSSKKNESPDFPKAVTMTDHHYVILFEKRVVAISRVTEKVVWEEIIPLQAEERAVGLAADAVNRTYWAYTDQAIYEITPREEDRDVWRGQLEKGNYNEALGFAKTPQQRDAVLSRRADHFFEQGKFMQAAQTYAQSSRSFEYVTLRFVDADERDGLRVYLADRLDTLAKTKLTQRMMLATWLVEIYLSKCNTLEDIIAAEAATSDVGSLKIELKMMEDDLRNFMTRYQGDLDRNVMYELIQSHGKTGVYLFFAGLVKDHGRVIEHWVTDGKWSKAIDVLNRQESVDLYYRFAPVLMRNIPKDTVDCWLRKANLDPRRLIPAMLNQQLQRSPSEVAHVIRYLTTVIERGNIDHTIYNLLITMYAASTVSDEGPLMNFLLTSQDNPLTGRPYYDLDYALRLCKQNNRIQACVHIYSKMGLYENSVDLALEKGDLELAKSNADKPEDDDLLRKKLWLKIAKHEVLTKRDVKSAMKLLEVTDLLKIEDLLPFFPDFVVIDDFKEEICVALEDYSTHIETLRAEMDEATKSAASITAEIENLRNRFVTVDATERCSHCQMLLMTRQFYVFPCQHVFHADCLITLAKDYLPSSSLRRIIHLQTELLKASGSSIRPANGTSTPTGGQRTLLSAQQSPDVNGSSDAAALLLGITGRNKLFAAGDKLRELIVPDVLASAVSVVGAGMGAGIGMGGKEKKGKKDGVRDEARMETLRVELDSLMAGSCVICEGSVASIDKPFIMPNERDDSWDL